jgi:pimeloyl-ACP methyl ester carboxylesterase
VATTTSRDGTIIAYDTTGDGPALILVAGAFQDRRAMAAYATPLADHFTVHTYDRRGRGDSGDTQPYAVEREIEDLAALIEVAGGRAFVFGGSSGAALALDAVEHGLNIPALALYEPPFVVDGSRPPVPDDLVAELTKLIADGRRGDAAELYLTRGANMSTDDVAGMRAAPFWGPSVEAAAPTLVYDAMIMDGTMTGGPLPVDRWTRVTVRTLIINGTDSFPYVDAATAALAALLPNAERTTLTGERHDVLPETLAPVMTEFFRPRQL